MQTLEINFKEVFESMPGKNVLLLPNPPFFTVVAISNAFCKATGVSRKKIVGNPIGGLLGHMNGLPSSSYSAFLESIEKAHATKLTQAWTFSDADDGSFHRRLIKVVNTPILSRAGEVIYVIQRITHLRRSNRIKFSPTQNARSAESVFTEIIMQGPVAIGVLKGSDMILATANMQMLDLWGKTRDIIGMPILKALPEISDQPFPQLLENVYRTGVEYHAYEKKAILKKDESLVECYFNFLYAPIRDETGSVEGILMIATDVTSLVKTKKDFEESERRYKDLIANATVATAVYTGERMEIHLANEAMLNLWGKDRSVIGKPLHEAIPELAGQPFLDILNRVYHTGITYVSSEDKAELVVDGRLQSFYFNFTYKPLYNTTGSIYGILNMAVDVTATVTAKNKINEAEERWRIALNSAELGTWDYYPLTNEFFCSQRTKELFGLYDPASDADVKAFLNVIDAKDQARVRDEVRKAIESNADNNFGVEYEVLGIQDHKQRWQRATGQVFFNEDRIACRITGTVLDITERKRIEEALEERVYIRTVELLEVNKKLERSNQELEQYAYVASHDLQEPLRKILVYTDLLKNSPLLKSGVEFLRLEKITASAIRMSHLIKDLLNFSRLLKTENVFSSVDLNQIVKNVIEDFELKIQETNAEIILNCLPEVEASSQQMNQLFYNLINNALKFKKDDQRPVIVISASVLSKKEARGFKDLNRMLTYYDIQIKDNGIGFNTKYVRHIFEIFKRLHTRSSYEGTGIGLALCRKIVRNHRGEIYAESKEGEGSVFHVLLPAKQFTPETNKKK